MPGLKSLSVMTTLKNLYISIFSAFNLFEIQVIDLLVLPDRILYRKKSPYPKTYNPEYERIVQEMFKKAIAQPDSILKDILHPNTLPLIRSGSNITWYGQLMGRPQLIAWLLQLDYWFREYGVKIV